MRVVLGILGLLLLLGAGEVLAALGQAPTHLAKPATAAANAAPLARSLAAKSGGQSNLYTLHETLLESGTVVREYASADGQVFAVTWRGPVLPDLSLLLGEHFKTFTKEAQRARGAGRRGSALSVQRDGLVARSGGRMRNFSGYAYAPAWVPGGFMIQDVLH